MTDEKPLKLHDGTLVYKDGRMVRPVTESTPESKPLNFVEVPTNREAQALVLNARKKLSDLPELPKTMNAVSAVLAYTLFGLDDDEISLALKITPARVADIRTMDAFNTMRNDIVANVLGAEQGDIRQLFVKHARNAADTVVHVMANGKNADRLKAAADILDRGGFRPSDVVEHRHRLEGGLTIEVIRKDNTLPTIDIDMEE